MKRTTLISLMALAAGAADFEVKDEAQFKKLFPANAKVERLATGLQFVEGPQWMKAGFLVFSDIPANELKRWDPKARVQTFHKPSQNANGNTLDREGRLLRLNMAGAVSPGGARRHGGKSGGLVRGQEA